MTSIGTPSIRRATSGTLPLGVLIRDVLATSWCVALVAITLLIVWRRLSGALVAPENGAVLLAACFTAGLLSLLSGQAASSRIQVLVDSVGPLALAASLTFPESRWPVWVMLWSVSAVPLVGATGVFGRGPAGSTDRRRIADRGNVEPSSTTARVLTTDPAAPQDVVQQLTRGRGADGCDTLVGHLRVRLEAGIRSQRAHVAFCPPFSAPPSVTVTDSEPREPQVRVGQVLPQGVRFDLKRRSASDVDADVEIHFRAVEESPGQD